MFTAFEVALHFNNLATLKCSIMKIHKFLSYLILPLALLAGCGGSSTSTTSPVVTPPVVTPPVVTPPVVTPTVNNIKVVPALGAFGAGANVTFIRPDGSQIAAAQTDATGAATLNMGAYTGPFISKVT